MIKRKINKADDLLYEIKTNNREQALQFVARIRKTPKNIRNSRSSEPIIRLVPAKSHPKYLTRVEIPDVRLVQVFSKDVQPTHSDKPLDALPIIHVVGLTIDPVPTTTGRGFSAYHSRTGKLFLEIDNVLYEVK